MFRAPPRARLAQSGNGVILNGLTPGPTGHRHEGLVSICLALLLGLFAVAMAGVLPRESSVRVLIAAAPGQPSPAVRNGEGVLLQPGGEGQAAAALLRFELPARDPGDDTRWVLQLERDPLEAIWLQRGEWRSPVLRFFAPDPLEGVLPVSYRFLLPADWSGPVELELHAAGDAGRTIHPRLVDMDQAARLEQYGVAASATIYASLFIMCLLALALFSAAHDRLFLMLFVLALVALLALGAGNGHLYALPGLGAFAFWGGQGLAALSLLLPAAWLQMLLRYADADRSGPWKRLVDGASLGLVAMAALCLLNLPQVGPVVQLSLVGLLVGALLLGFALLFDAGRRRILMAWPLAALAVLTLAGVLLAHLSTRGQVADTVLVRYGYQMGVVVGVALLAVGLIGRIAEFRQQRDRESLARADTERRMQRESARTALSAELQAQLRTLPVQEIESTAFDLLVAHLQPLLPAQRWTVMTQGHRGSELLLSEPPAGRQALKERLDRRQLALRRQAAGTIPLQQPLTSEASRSIVAMEALVPLQIRAPAWGVLLLERAGADGFTTEELSLAADFARVTLMHVDQAIATVNLRRSAELDALTGSLNRRTIDQWLARSFDEGAREGQPVSVLFIDLDHFKAVNDRHGHACGDACLRAVAQALRGALREGDLFGRYGGEEFIAILPGRGGAEARLVAEQLRLAVEHLCPQWEGQTLRLTVSVGVATRLEHESQPDAALARADRALYAAKAGGRNCVQVAPAVFT